jgi:protein kinase C substrate 80K-H
VCDCCDASDEWATGACSNQCEEVGRAAREEAVLAAKRRAEGSKIRQEMIAAGQTTAVSQRTEIEALKPNKDEAEAEQEKAKVAKEQAEEPENVC